MRAATNDRRREPLAGKLRRLKAVVLLCGAGLAISAYADGDAAKGREISIKHCAGCHVVGDYNPMGGIGSTPSFQGLTFLSDYVERLLTFYLRRPHVAFVQVPGVESIVKSSGYGRPFTISHEEIAHVVAFVKTLAKQ